MHHCARVVEGCAARAICPAELPIVRVPVFFSVPLLTVALSHSVAPVTVSVAPPIPTPLPPMPKLPLILREFAVTFNEPLVI